MAQALSAGEASADAAIDRAAARAAALPCWAGPVNPEPLGGGITNRNFVVSDRGQRFVVRIGGDIPVHGVMRFNDLAAARAAHAAGLSPEVVHAEPDAIVIRFVDGRTLSAEDFRDENMLARVLPLVRRCHREVARHLRGPVLVFWVFHVIRDYAATIAERRGPRRDRLPEWLDAAARLERAVQPIELVFAHNDLLAANFIDDGKRLWLIDWDYAGFNSPLFDLGGLAGNNGLSAEQETWLLEAYFERAVDDALRRRYDAMKCAALLREGMWGLASTLCSSIEHDFAAYADSSLTGFEQAWTSFQERWGRG